jgi:hypothetical protein
MSVLNQIKKLLSSSVAESLEGIVIRGEEIDGDQVCLDLHWTKTIEGASRFSNKKISDYLKAKFYRSNTVTHDKKSGVFCVDERQEDSGNFGSSLAVSVVRVGVENQEDGNTRVTLSCQSTYVHKFSDYLLHHIDKAEVAERKAKGLKEDGVRKEGGEGRENEAEEGFEESAEPESLSVVFNMVNIASSDWERFLTRLEGLESFFKSHQEEADESARGDVPLALRPFVKTPGSLADAKNWKAYVHAANSGGTVGEWDKVGYIMFHTTEDVIVPIARSDEHHQGYDLIDSLKRKKMIPRGDYIPLWIYHSGSYLRLKELEEVKPVLKKWMEKGGQDGLINISSSGYQKTSVLVSDIVSGKVSAESLSFSIENNEVSQLAISLVRALESTATANSNIVREGGYDLAKKRDQKSLCDGALQTARLGGFLTEALLKKDSEKLRGPLAELITTSENLNDDPSEENRIKLEQALFSFNGFKNVLHNIAREIVALVEKNGSGYSVRVDEFSKVVGNPAGFLQALNAISDI